MRRWLTSIICLIVLLPGIASSQETEPKVSDLYGLMPVKNIGVEVILAPEVIHLYGGGRTSGRIHIQNVSDIPLKGWFRIQLPERFDIEESYQQFWIAPGASITHDFYFIGYVDDKLLHGTCTICTPKGVMDIPIWLELRTNTPGLSAPIDLEEYYNTDIIASAKHPGDSTPNAFDHLAIPARYIPSRDARLSGILFVPPPTKDGLDNAIHNAKKPIVMSPRPAEGFALLAVATKPISNAKIVIVDEKAVRHEFTIDIPAYTQRPAAESYTGITAPFCYKDGNKLDEPVFSYVMPILFGKTIKIASVELPSDDNLYTLAMSSLRVRNVAQQHKRNK